MLLIKTINWINKDKIYRNNFLKNEINNKILKSLLYNEKINIKKKIIFDFKIKKFLDLYSITKCRSNCIFLGNSRSIIHKFKLSRHSSKKYAGLGYITGLRKSSF